MAVHQETLSIPWPAAFRPGLCSLSRPMRIGVPRESVEGERRVALVPEVVSKHDSDGLEVD